MRGHVRKRGATWSVIYDEPGENGKRRQRWRGGFATKREAESFLATTLNRLGDGSYVAPAKLTLGTYLEEEWLPAIVDTVRPLTYGIYRSMARISSPGSASGAYRRSQEAAERLKCKAVRWAT